MSNSSAVDQVAQGVATHGAQQVSSSVAWFLLWAGLVILLTGVMALVMGVRASKALAHGIHQKGG